MQENRQRKKTDGIKHIIGTADSGDVPHDGSRLCHREDRPVYGGGQ